MFDHVIVGVEFSAGGEAVLRSLPALKSLGVRRITLASVVEPINPLNTDVDYMEALGARLEAERELLERAGFDVDARVAGGEVAATLREIARESDGSMVVIGSRSHSRVTDLFLGSTAWAVVRESHLPVLLQRVERVESDGGGVRMLAPARIDRVVFPTDWSATAERAFGYVEALARSGGVASFLLLHVRSQIQEVRTGESTEEADLLRLEQLTARLRALGVADVAAEAPSGAPFLEIARRADSRPGSLIVMGTRGRRIMGDAFLGGVSRDVVRGTRSPVLLVPPA